VSEHKGKLSLFLGWGCMACSVLIGFVIILPLVGVTHPILSLITIFLEQHFSFTAASSLFGLAPLLFLLSLWTIMIFSFRGKKRFSYILIPLTCLMFYTLYSLSHMMQQTQQSYLAAQLLSRSEDLRSASFTLVLLFLGQMVLFVVLTLVGDFLQRYQQVKQERLRKRALKREQKQKIKAKKQRKSKKEPEEQEEQETVTLQKKPVKEEELKNEPVSFPEVVEVPALKTLSKKKPGIEPPQKKDVIEVDEIQVLGKVSIGALHTLGEERKRNNGVTYLERRQQLLHQEKQSQEKKPEMLSGFLQGALEAVGKVPKNQSIASKREGKAHGMLAEAVEQHGYAHIEEEHEPLQPEFYAPLQAEKPKEVQDEEQSKSLEEQELFDLDVRGVAGLQEKSALLNKEKISYQFPSESMLVTYPQIGDVIDERTVKRGEVLVETLRQFNISVELIHIVRGPTVTMFELLPAPGIRVNSIVNLSDNIALALAATQVRIVAPIPGKSAVGVEIPNLKRDIIGFAEMLEVLPDDLGIPMVLGRNLMGERRIIDVIKTPHLLIAGSTGSGKSVCVNSLICSVLFRCTPKQVRMILVDPKIVELNIYNGIPHLLTEVITDAKKTLKALDFCLYEMDRRYKLLQSINVRNIIGYNEKIEKQRIARERLPYILVVIDEFADLMHLVGKDMESKVSRLAAMSRAVGIHLVLATQRPSVDVITGVIKNNIPTRIAFAVTSSTDSRIILDEVGADKLLGKGDMLYMSSSNPATERIQGAFLSDQEVEQVVRFASSQGEPEYIDDSFFEDDEHKGSDHDDEDVVDSNDDDELLQRALAIVVERKCASASYLQRRLKIGYNRAARMVELMEELGYVGPPNGSKPRELIKYP